MRLWFISQNNVLENEHNSLSLNQAALELSSHNNSWPRAIGVTQQRPVCRRLLIFYAALLSRHELCHLSDTLQKATPWASISSTGLNCLWENQRATGDYSSCTPIWGTVSWSLSPLRGMRIRVSRDRSPPECSFRCSLGLSTTMLLFQQGAKMMKSYFNSCWVWWELIVSAQLWHSVV